MFFLNWNDWTHSKTLEFKDIITFFIAIGMFLNDIGSILKEETDHSMFLLFDVGMSFINSDSFTFPITNRRGKTFFLLFCFRKQR